MCIFKLDSWADDPYPSEIQNNLCTYTPFDNLDITSERNACDISDNGSLNNSCTYISSDIQDSTSAQNNDSDLTECESPNTFCTKTSSDNIDKTSDLVNAHQSDSLMRTPSHKDSNQSKIQINRNPPALDKDAWEEINTEFAKVDEDSWNKFRTKETEPEKYIETLNK